MCYNKTVIMYRNIININLAKNNNDKYMSDKTFVNCITKN